MTIYWLFLEDKVHGEYQENKANEVIHPEIFVFKEHQGENGEYDERYHFLNDFELQ